MSFEKIVRVQIGGRVQGVGFRAFVERNAVARGIVGWVRNHGDGDVEAVFAGSESAVAALCEVCRRGPTPAQVERLEVFEADRTALGKAAETGEFVQLGTV